jgi:hypothetical protein
MKKLRKLINVEEAIFLGLTPKKNEKRRNQARYVITESQWAKVRDYRNEKALAITGTSTLEDKDGNVRLKWVKRNQDKEDLIKALKSVVDGLKDEIEPVKPVKLNNKNHKKNLCNQYVLTDYHLGMMSWGEETGSDWDLKIAEDTLIKFFSHAIKTSPNAETAIFAQIGDFLHWDGLDAVTPASKHVLDADTRFTKLVRVAIRVIRNVITMLLQKHKKVTVIMAEGNHDPASSVWLREMLHAFYENEERLEIDTNPDPYYCVTFGEVCLFYHHGHKKNIKNIDTAFVGKFKKEFGGSKYVYGHTGHLHHDLKIESNLMVLEQHRTLAAKDAYASRGGYLSGRDSKVITYHKKYGEVGRNTINICMIN